MAKYRKKPVVIDAWRYSPYRSEQASEDMMRMREAGIEYSIDGLGFLVISTLEGEMRAGDGDWIIKGVNGEFYPCKPDIFAKTYEAVDANA